jgi:hypothetical protein
MRLAILFAFAVSMVPSVTWAQQRIAASPEALHALAQLRPAATGSEPGRAARTRLALGSAPDYRWEGMAIGAGLLGVVGALLLRSACEKGESCVGPTLGGFGLGVLVGGISGGFIGATIPKD